MRLRLQGQWGVAALLLVFNAGCGDDSSPDQTLPDAGSDASTELGATQAHSSDESDSNTETSAPNTTESTVTDSVAPSLEDGGSTSEPSDDEATLTMEDAATTNTEGDASSPGLDWQAGPVLIHDTQVEYATLEVPVDYSNPAGAKLELAMVRVASTSAERQGVMLFNPGGPGYGVTADVDYWGDLLATVFPTLDIVLVDNRGTGFSTPIDCATTDEANAWEVDDSGPLETELSQVSAFQAACLDRQPDLIRYFNVENVARDMDSVRSALGEEKLNFWGASYGTLQGAVYAKMFPESVRSFILDSPVVRQPDGSPNWVELITSDAESYETQLGRFFDWSDTDPSSPWLAAQGFGEQAPVSEASPAVADADAATTATADVADGGVTQEVDRSAEPGEGTAQDAAAPDGAEPDAAVAELIPMVAVFDLLNEQLAAGAVWEDTELPPNLLLQLSGTLIRMGDWETLSLTIISAAQNDWSVAIGLYVDLGIGIFSEQDFRDAQGNWAINLLDTQCPENFDFDQASELYADLSTRFPRLGAQLAAGIADCVVWTLEPTEPRIAPNDVSAPPMLVLGADNDPATPYVNAVALVEELNNGSHLLTSHTPGHGVGIASTCGAVSMALFAIDPDVSALPDECDADPVEPAEAANKVHRLNLAAGARHRMR